MTQLFLANGNPVFGIEPNHEMRTAAEKCLTQCKCFKSINGSAEATTLPNRSVDFIVVGHAAHWFAKGPTRIEFARILKPTGSVALIWNTRDGAASEFMSQYEHLMIKHAIDETGQPGREGGGLRAPDEFICTKFQKRVFENLQQLDIRGLIGRTCSSSMMPLHGQAGFKLMVAELERLFNAYEEDRIVTLSYRTELYFSNTPRLLKMLKFPRRSGECKSEFSIRKTTVFVSSNTNIGY